MRNIESLRPSDTPEFMTPAWLGCIQFAIGKEDIRKAFEAESGLHIEAGRTSAIEQMVDSATGYGKEREAHNERYFEEFVKWVNINVWGPLETEH